MSSPKLVCTLGGGALAAAAAGALNCLWEMDLDKNMKRTSGRALPAGKLSFNTVFFGAISCTLAAAMLLVSGVNYLAAGLTLLGLCSYVLLYTIILKPRTTQNIVIGGSSRCNTSFSWGICSYRTYRFEWMVAFLLGYALDSGTFLGISYFTQR